MTALTWGIGTQVNRYAAQSAEVPGELSSDASRWILRKNWKTVDQLDNVKLLDNGVQITQQTPEITEAEYRVKLPNIELVPGTRLLASAELVAEGIPNGEEIWHGLLYAIWFYDDEGNRIKKSGRSVQALRGDTTPLRYARELDFPEGATSIGISLRIFKNTGVATMHAPKVQLVAPWAGYQNVLYGVLGAWCLFGLWVLISMASRGALLYALPPIAVIAVIAVGVSLPSDSLKQLTIPLENMSSGLMPLFQTLGLYSIQKAGHAITFALLTFFVCLVRRPVGATWLGAASFVVLLALLTEGVQLYFVGRSTRAFDVFVDLGGALAGALVFFCLWLLLKPFRTQR